MNKLEEYERRKSEAIQKCKSAEEYEEEMRKITKELKL